MSHRIRLVLLVFVPLLFFVTGLFTLGDYGVNGDEPHHFQRGQAFLNYYLTGSHNYDTRPDLPESPAARVDDPLATTVFSDRDSAAARYSVYQNRDYPASLFLGSNEMGHPPLNDILAAASNRLLYGQLGLVGDLESYHLFEIVIATVGIAITMWWAYIEFGFTAALIAGVALALHPMYLGESRFNIKDPIETTAYIGTLFAIWQLVRNPFSPRFWWWVLAAGLFGGVGLGTKFNILFTVPTVALWLIVAGIVSLVQKILPNPSLQKEGVASPFAKGDLGGFWTKASRLAVGLLFAAILAFAIFYATWPYLWTDPFSHLKQVIDYYRGIGIGGLYANNFIQANGWDLYPLLDVIVRVPLITWLLSAIGLAGFIRYRKTPRFATLLLWGLWLVIPILRVSVPNTSIYGATRQIMEYLPALTLFAGVGATMIVDSATNWLGVRRKGLGVPTKTKAALTPHASRFTSLFNTPTLLTGILLLCYLPVVVTLTRLHPNPQLFYNSLIGGLKGAHDMNFPFWYNTMGNQYGAAIDWLNEHAEPNAKVSLVFNDNWFLPPGRLRPDIHLSAHQLDYFSREGQAGEYLVSLIPVGTTSWTTDYQSAATRYLERFIAPIYIYQVDGVTLLKIWRNDAASQLPRRSVVTDPEVPLAWTRNSHHLELDFGKTYQFDRLEILPGSTVGCQSVTSGHLSVSVDGKVWSRLENLEASTEPFVYLFSGESGRFISIEQESGSCVLTSEQQLLFVTQPSETDADPL